MERRASEELAAAIAAGNVPTPWLGIYATVEKTMMALTVRLRLGPLSRSNNNRRSPGKPGTGSLSYYEVMDFSGKDDAEARPRRSAPGGANGEGS